MALRGYKVIEFAGLAPGPFCGMILRDHGASVIRVDKPFTTPNVDSLGRGKRSLVVDFKKPASSQILTKLCSNADVLIDPFRPGVMEKFNLGPSDLCNVNPKLIYARLTGFGQNGPFSKMAGHDINYIAISEICTYTRFLGKRSTPFDVYMIYIIRVPLSWASSVQILANCLDSSALKVEGSAYVSSWLWTTRSKSFPYPLWPNPPGKNLLDGGAHFYQTYETKDEKFMAVGALEPPFYETLLKGMDLTSNDNPQEINASEFHERLANTFLTKTQEEWCKIFDLTDACVTPVVPIEEAHKHPHNAHNQSFLQKDGKIVPIPAPRLSRTPGEPCLREPYPGEHTQEVLLEAGFKENEIQSFIEQKTVYWKCVKSTL
ncbi:alpha-methylacyl-CoA racemase [Trichonephila clavata]|uniref:Alpha-methylacyl-CoA racemase n=1 Tax=Trichonephila clavata TaxID=2740835 RepID=A0A8X6KGG7_TRICU|nr:alpha-methylacyl-CoA racemase [Trichonephila clavata]